MRLLSYHATGRVPQSLPMTTVLVTLLAVVVALAALLTIESRIGGRIESPARRRDGHAPDSVT
jgi:hypothetical protein